MTQHLESAPFTRNDAQSIGVLMRLMSSQTDTEPPAMPLYRVRGVAEAYVLAAIAYDIRRKRQLVVMSPDKYGWRLDPAEVTRAVGAQADVIMIDDRATIEHVAGAITRELTPFSGYVRIFRPGLCEADGEHERRRRHPGVKPGLKGASPQQALEEIARKVSEGTRLGEARPITDDDLAAAVEAAVQAEREKTAEAATRLVSLKRSLKTQEQQAPDERPVFADPHAQFRHELHRAWLVATKEGDRAAWPLRDWELGEVFLDSIAEQQIVDRARVIRACVDVITGRHREINSRASHKLRTSEGGDAAPVIREEDGAVAWRCSINSGPAAARLMWWELEGNRPQLSVVAAHNDIRIA